MRTFAQFIFVLASLILFPLLLISATFKFELLNYDFWIGNFESRKTYESLSNEIKNSVDNQIVNEGGNKKDISVFTELITPENTKDFVNKNLFNLLNFANGKSDMLMVYIPLEKIPKGLLPKSVSDLKENMTINDLSKKLHISGIEYLPFEYISNVGKYSDYLFYISLGILITLLILIFAICESQKKLIYFGLTILLEGIMAFLMAIGASNQINNFLSRSSEKISLNRVVFVTVIPPVLRDIFNIWNNIAIVLIVVGAILMFVKKPWYTKSSIKQVS